jgi:peptidoglycan/xylan/chitin deacetylase (PgdA/CDA1 family)
MNRPRKLRVAFLTGGDSAATRLSVETVCQLPDVETVALLLDTERAPFQRRLKNLRRNIRREGWQYLPLRAVEAVRSLTDALVDRAAVSPEDTRKLLAEAFPDRSFALADLSAKYGFEIKESGNLNGPVAVEILRKLNVDLGIVIGTRVLKEAIFSVPAMGCINLHKGRVPDYRGLPPGFWELYDGAGSAGVTVHFVDKGLDTGDVIAESVVPITPSETPESLQQKLNEEGTRLLAEAVTSIQMGTARRTPQPRGTTRTRTKPTRKQLLELESKLPHWRPRKDIEVVCKNLYCLTLFYTGIYSLVRRLHGLSKARCAILLYHRVNDFSKDILTVDTETFAAQLLAVKARYPQMSTTELVSRIKQRQPIPPTSVVIHFDDCYRDVWSNGAAILKAAGLSATAFISSGFIGTDRRFAHDVNKYPFVYPNLSADEIRDWLEKGFEVGSHTVNHVDLGTCPVDDARYEVTESRSQLEAIGGRPVTFFSFPFGRAENISKGAAQAVVDEGYAAMFSAYTGFVGAETKLFDIPRMGANGDFSPLYLLLEIEGLNPGQLFSGLKSAKSKSAPA